MKLVWETLHEEFFFNFIVKLSHINKLIYNFCNILNTYFFNTLYLHIKNDIQLSGPGIEAVNMQFNGILQLLTQFTSESSFKEKSGMGGIS